MARVRSSQTSEADVPGCSIERTVDIIGDRWSFLILRQVLLYRSSRFSEFQAALAIAPNILTDRLDTLVAAGILEKRPYQTDGARARSSYHPTPAGQKLVLVLGALQQWGDEFVPLDAGPTVLRRTAEGDHPLHLAFVDDSDIPVGLDDVTFVPGPGFASPDYSAPFIATS